MKLLISLLLWSLLLVVCWPLAAIVVLAYPIVWLLVLPFRVVGLTIDLVFKLVSAILLFPFRIFARAK